MAAVLSSDRVWDRLTGPVLLLCFWPVWPWYLQRLQDGSDEPWGILALLTLAGLMLWPGSPPERGSVGWVEPQKQEQRLACWLGLYLLSYAFVPMLVRAALAALTLATWLAGRVGRGPGVYGLALLSLPLLASLQFYLGYPLRLLITRGAALLLHVSGVPVTPAGTALQLGTRTVLVDAACSGVQMLWVSTYLSCCLLLWFRLHGFRAWLLLMASLLLVVLANLSRAVTLFYSESGLFPAFAGFHTLTGLFIFALLTAGLVSLGQYLQRDMRRALAAPVRQVP